jgi:hypothetical protein
MASTRHEGIDSAETAEASASFGGSRDCEIVLNVQAEDLLIAA